MDKETKFITLYEHLGYTIGPGLYEEVYTEAMFLKEPIKRKLCNGGRYKRELRYYRKEFLNNYFNERKRPNF